MKKNIKKKVRLWYYKIMLFLFDEHWTSLSPVGTSGLILLLIYICTYALIAGIIKGLTNGNIKIQLIPLIFLLPLYICNYIVVRKYTKKFITHYKSKLKELSNTN